MRRPRALIVSAALGLLLAAPAAGQVLRYPADAIVMQEVYNGCELARAGAYFNPALYPEFRIILRRAYDTQNPAIATAAHQRALEVFPQAALITVRIGNCGESG